MDEGTILHRWKFFIMEVFLIDLIFFNYQLVIDRGKGLWLWKKIFNKKKHMKIRYKKSY